ncbi:MAG: Fic family protein [Thermodesulfobacteriota bacterium]
MKSFEFDYLLETPITHKQAMTLRTLGEYRGRQALNAEQSPEVLETLRKVAMVQSTESSNRIEGITAGPGQVDRIVMKKAEPKDRSEQEIAGYRDILEDIHANHMRITLSTQLIRRWHEALYRYTGTAGGSWKEKDNAIIEVGADGKQYVRFQTVSSLATPQFMERLITLFNQSLDQGKTDPLFLIASFILDFECIHPFWDGNGRIGRLLSLLLLYQSGYEVGRYIGLERIVEESKETYYEALLKSSTRWHEADHDLGPWWNYFMGMLVAAYKEFEARVGTITSSRGAKREMVQNAVDRLPDRFRIEELRQACPGVSYPTLQRALSDMRKAGRIRCLGRGPDAEWQKVRG